MPPAPKKSSGGAPAAAAATELDSATHQRRLPYRRPLPVFLPVVLLFVLLNYLAFGEELDATGEHLVLPAYVHGLVTRHFVERMEAATGDAPEQPLPFNVFLFFEEKVMGSLFQLGRLCFRSHFGVQIVTVGAWLIHAFELGVCFRICWSCNAAPLVALRYMLCTAVAGFAQLSPLMKARDAWVTEVRASAAGAAAVAAAPNAKKKAQ